MLDKLSKLKNTKAENKMLRPDITCSFFPQSGEWPMIIKPAAPGLILKEWVRSAENELRRHLEKYGAVLFRGFQVDTVEKFQHFIGHFVNEPLAYTQRSSPRYEVAKNIYHSTTYPADQAINMHSENSYARHPAMNIVFCCIQPAEEQGETPIADNRRVVRGLSAATRGRFMEKGVKYLRNISPGIGLPWQEIFQTTDRQVVEKECVENEMDYTWKSDDHLVLSWTGKAIQQHPVTGEEVWFNHAFFFNKYALHPDAIGGFASPDDLPFNTYFGDGAEISRAEIEEIRSAYLAASFVFPWEKGDVLFLDNMLTSHGRSPYTGERKILVSMF